MTRPGSTLKGREYDKAREAIDRVLDLTYTRAETARRAVAATLAYLGARRILVATRDTPDGSEDRRTLTMLADIETIADRLDSIPQRSETASVRQETWHQITGLLVAVRRRLDIENTMARQASA